MSGLFKNNKIKKSNVADVLVWTLLIIEAADGHDLFTLLDNGRGLNMIALLYAARKVVAELLMKWLNRGTAV